VPGTLVDFAGYSVLLKEGGRGNFRMEAS